MNENTKKAGLVAVAVIAVGAAAYSGYKLFASPSLEQGVNHPSPAKSMAQMEREKMEREDAAAAKGQVGSGAAAENSDDPSASLAGRR